MSELEKAQADLITIQDDINKHQKEYIALLEKYIADDASLIATLFQWLKEGAKCN